ncbi:MAG: PD-(D/E)XK nuclease family protein, partial [Phycisphaerae bacterium]|nr:PD-(D/E)XK nuclease family protein [Phycisphaerae bacterium]
ARQIIAAAPTGVAAPPLLGALPAGAAQVEVAVTALADFAVCPMLYRWQHELRIGRGLVPASGQPGEHRGRAAPLDPTTLGTLLHRCMEMLDFAHPQPARALVTGAACQLHLEETADLEPIAEEFQAMLDRLAAQPLWQALTSAKATLRELDFTLSLVRPGSRQGGPAVVRGQIALLVQDARGAWRIVDYKSDQVGPAAVPEHARRYELQLLAYAVAARRHLGCPPVEAVLYFLRPGVAHQVPLDEAALAGAEQRLAETAGRLAAARRSGRFERAEPGYCAFCPYRSLCQRHGVAGP